MAIKISVVVPMYNAEKFIAKCLDHLTHQTYRDLEIILVDDGSRDNTVAVANGYAATDARIKIIRQANSGPGGGSNTGLDAATGDYIHFHDHDDFVNLDYFEKMANAATLTDADILCGEVNQPEYNFPKFSAIQICRSLADKIHATRANKFHPAWRYVYKKSFLDKIGLRFETAIIGAQDVFFTRPAIVLADTVATVPGAIYNVVNTPTALGKTIRRARKFHKTCVVPSADVIAAHRRYNELMARHNAAALFAAPDQPWKIEEFRIFNMPLFRRQIFPNKIRYYLFGINIGTRRIIIPE